MISVLKVTIHLIILIKEGGHSNIAQNFKQGQSRYRYVKRLILRWNYPIKNQIIRKSIQINNIVNYSLHNPQNDGHSTCADAVVQKLGEAATSRRQASELMSLHGVSADDAKQSAVGIQRKNIITTIL